MRDAERAVARPPERTGRAGSVASAAVSRVRFQGAGRSKGRPRTTPVSCSHPLSVGWDGSRAFRANGSITSIAFAVVIAVFAVAALVFGLKYGR